MPQFLKSNDKYIVVYMTGPKHVALGIALSLDSVQTITVVKKPATGGCEYGKLNEKKIQESVVEGVSKANKELRTEFTVSEINYVENDSPAYDLYAHCAYLIVKGIKEGIEFREIDKW